MSAFSVRSLTSFILAANWAALGICYNSGQDCTAGSRVYVQESIYDKFIKLLVSKVKAQVIGNGLDEATGGGPMVTAFLVSNTSPPVDEVYRSLRDSMSACGITLKLENGKGLKLL